jgi:hypothetical protein
MKLMSRCVVLVTIALAAGCLAKPAPWTPDGLIGDDMGGEVEIRRTDGALDFVATDILGEIENLDVPAETDNLEVVPAPLLVPGPSICPGRSGGWQGTAYRATISWHRNMLMMEE